MEKKYRLDDIWNAVEMNGAKYNEEYVSPSGMSFGVVQTYKLENRQKLCRVSNNGETVFKVVPEDHDLRELLVEKTNSKTEYIMNVFMAFGQKAAEDFIGLQREDVFIDDDGKIDEVEVYVVQTRFYNNGERHSFYCNSHGTPTVVLFDEFIQMQDMEANSVCHLMQWEYRRPIFTAIAMNRIKL